MPAWITDWHRHRSPGCFTAIADSWRETYVKLFNGCAPLPADGLVLQLGCTSRLRAGHNALLHTLLHEFNVSFNRGTAQKGMSLTLGKGFAPYGTDDPMSRPALKLVRLSGSLTLTVVEPLGPIMIVGLK